MGAVYGEGDRRDATGRGVRFKEYMGIETAEEENINKGERGESGKDEWRE